MYVRFLKKDNMIRSLIIYDEKPSSRNQCETLLNELKKKKKIECDRLLVRKKIFHHLPNVLIFILLKISYLIRKKKPKEYNLIVSCGRTSAPYNLILSKKKYTKNYHILDPYFGRKFFTSLIIPYHDRKKFKNYKNIYFTIGALANKSEIKKPLITKGKKVISCLIGGSGKSSNLLIDDISECLTIMNKLSKKYKVIYCFSRRTPEKIKTYIINNMLKYHDYYPKKGINPYKRLLSSSSYFVVTQDSVGMISDVLKTGKSLYLIELKNIKQKLRYFTEYLKKKKLTKVFDGKFKKYSYPPLNESERIAALIIKNLTIDYETKSIDQDIF